MIYLHQEKVCSSNRALNLRILALRLIISEPRRIVATILNIKAALCQEEVKPKPGL
jgi:hypothetical protein